MAQAQTKKAVVREVGDALVLELEVGGRQRQLNRQIDEPLEKVLNRLAVTKGPKAKKGSSAPPAAAVRVEVARDGMVVDAAAVTAGVGLLGDGSRTLTVGAETFTLVVNPPRVVSVTLPERAIVGIPLFPIVQAEHCNENELEWRWFAEPSSPSPSASSTDGKGESVLLGEGRSYSPSAADLGATLRVRCSPTAAPAGVECAAETATARAVEPAPQRSFHERRLAALSAREEGALRFVTYNALADNYRRTWNGLYPYVPEDVHDPHRRLQLAVQEVLELSPDVALVQEVDVRWFERLWEPRLAAAGFAGVHLPKAKGMQEGLALFVRESELELVTTQSIVLNAVAEQADRSEIHARIAALLSDRPRLRESLLRTSTVALLALVRHRHSGRHLVITNTHLFYHPHAGHIRVIQAALIAAEAERLRLEAVPSAAVVIAGDFNGEAHDGVMRFLLSGLIEAGDDEWGRGSLFRFSYRGAAAAAVAAAAAGEDPREDPEVLDSIARIARLRELVLRARESEGAAAAAAAAVDEEGEEEEVAEVTGPGLSAEEAEEALALRDAIAADRRTAVERQRRAAADAGAAVVADGARLELPFRVDSAYASAPPEFTNYVGGFVGALDWLLLERDQGLRVLQTAAMPTEAEVTAETALPSTAFPSDHVSIAADVAIPTL